MSSMILKPKCMKCMKAREVSRATSTASSSTQDQLFTTGALVTHFSQSVCVFCKRNDHSLFVCPTISQAAARRSVLAQENRCFNCIKVGHNSTGCTSASSCRNCGERHHTSIFSQGTSAPPNRTHIINIQPLRTHHIARKNPRGGQTTPTVVAYDSQPKVTNYPDVETDSTTLIADVNAKSVLMQIALAKVKDPAGEQHTIRLLFDTASQGSYVTDDLYKKLRLTPTEPEELTISGFTETCAMTRIYDTTLLQCTSCLDETGHTIQAIVVPQITPPISRRPLNHIATSFVTDLDLADPQLKPGLEWMNIDVLVGLDHNSKYVCGPIVKIPGTELIAIASLFGHLVCGRNGSATNSELALNTLINHIIFPFEKKTQPTTPHLQTLPARCSKATRKARNERQTHSKEKVDPT